MGPTSTAPVKRSKILWLGLILMIGSVAPLLLYIIFGPKDGNPIGLGLLMFFGFPTGLIVFIVGVVRGSRR